MVTEFRTAALEKFVGCDGGDPGSAQFPSIWVLGIEHGIKNGVNDPSSTAPAESDGSYSIATQLKYRFNNNAFALLAAIFDHPVKDYINFARMKQPFVKGSKGFFKGNIYPIACSDVSSWPPEAEAETGMSKEEYRRWCDEFRLPVLASWIEEYRPQVVIGVGLMNSDQFSRAVFGRSVPLLRTDVQHGAGKTKRLMYAHVDGKKLVVVSHLSWPQSDLGLTNTGIFIRQLIEK
ncbi:MAG: hypothetical protein U1E71_00815 [Ramlibacter sp.]